MKMYSICDDFAPRGNAQQPDHSRGKARDLKTRSPRRTPLLCRAQVLWKEGNLTAAPPLATRRPGEGGEIAACRPRYFLHKSPLFKTIPPSIKYIPPNTLKTNANSVHNLPSAKPQKPVISQPTPVSPPNGRGSSQNEENAERNAGNTTHP
jgi:hypothetical protein